MGPLQQLLWMNPQLWNHHPFRREFPDTPHAEVDDIWVRYMPDESDMNDSGVVESVWHEEAKVLGGPLAPLVLDIMRATNSYQLDRVLLTRLAPGGHILPHSDAGAAYTSLSGIARYHVVVQGLAGSTFRCGEEVVNMVTGEVWWFNALLEHECLNASEADRIHLLVDARVWPGPGA